MPEYHAVSGSAAEDLFIELFSDAFGAEKAGSEGMPREPGQQRPMPGAAA